MIVDGVCFSTPFCWGAENRPPDPPPFFLNYLKLRGFWGIFFLGEYPYGR